jgi:uncharacterized repeat protein (TIGR01451 family)
VPDPGDEPLDGVQIELTASGSGEVVLSATTDSLGAFLLLDVPVGSYRIRVDTALFGDSLEAVGAGDAIAVEVGDSTQVNIGVTYPSRAIEELAAEPVGRRVFTSGIALNQRLNFDPTGRVHFAGDSLFLRALNVERSGVSVGDSVRLLGRIVTDNGRLALDEVTPAILVPAAALPLPREIALGDAASAGGGALDAALVRVRNVEITDTSTNLQGHFRFWAFAGADSVEVVLRDFLGFNTSAVRPDTVVWLAQAAGLLTPIQDGAGGVRWQMLPRASGDVVLQTRSADVGVTLSVDTASATLGDTVEVTVVATNAGPLTARGAEVEASAPAALAVVSSTQTTGSFSSGTGLWSIGDLQPGAADTLTVRYEVTDGTAATLILSAQSGGLVTEVDPQAANDTDSAALVIS